MATRRSSSSRRQRKTAGEAGAQASADELARLAKEEGATGPYGTAASRALRDAAILARIAAGGTQAQAASEFGLSERAIRLIAKRARATPSPLDERPMQVLEDLLRAYRLMRADLAVLAWANVDRNPAVALGAKKAELAILEAYTQLLIDVGHLPVNLSLFKAESELYQLADLMLGKLGEVERGKLKAAEMATWIRDAIMAGRPLPTANGADVG